jgi:hypothetical protein
MLLYNGSIVCAGENDFAELGIGSSDRDDRRTLIPATALAGIHQRGCRWSAVYVRAGNVCS